MMEIRPASVADSETIAGLVLKLLDELSGEHPSGYTLTDLAHTAKALLREEAIVALLVEKAGAAIAVVVLNPCASLYAGHFGEITEFYVMPEFRSAGVGADLITAAISTSRARSWTRLEVGTPELPAWDRTASFYRRNGFIEIGARMKLPLQSDSTDHVVASHEPSLHH